MPKGNVARDWSTDKPVEQWDLEELRRGQVRNSRGTFTGRPPKSGALPRHIHEELWRRVMDDAARKLRDGVPEALDGVMALARDEEIPPQVRLAAYTYWIDRVYGKPLQPMTHAVVATSASQPRAPWEEAALEASKELEPAQVSHARKLLGREMPETIIARLEEENRQLREEQIFTGTSRSSADTTDDEALMRELIDESR